jgi:ADP-ribose 1''-phosphate phosphatase
MPTTRSKTKPIPFEASPEQNTQTHPGGEPENRYHRSRQQNSDTISTPNITITDLTGDLTIDPPDNSIVIHSVNCLGEWGSGVALALAKALPDAFEVYRNECKRQTSPESLLGQVLLIPPQKGDYDLTPAADGSGLPRRPRRWVCCLFVSEGYGRATKTKPGKAKPADIIRHTRRALELFRNVLSTGKMGEVVLWESETEEAGRGEKPKLDAVWACKFNSGSFGVKWQTTLDIIKEVFQEDRDGVAWGGEIKVVSRD